MNKMTQEQHLEVRNAIKDAAKLMKSNGVREDIADFMESSALNIAGGIKGKSGPEVVMSGDSEDTMGSYEDHESYGQVCFSRISCSPMDLYGSNIQQGSVISLTISRSSKNRNLSHDRFHPGEEIISVLLSPAQFSELLTSLNVGSGVPCTIEHLFYNRMNGAPGNNQGQINRDEFNKVCKKAGEDSKNLIAEIKEIFDSKKSIGKADREKILGKINNIQRIFHDKIPFMQEQYAEAMEKTEVEAKNSVDAFVIHALTSIGAEDLKNKIVKLPEAIDAKALPLD